MSTTTEPTRGLCFDCNYPLDGLDSARCPECGRPFDPADYRTVNTAGPIGPLVRLTLRPVKWVFPAGIIAASVAVLFCNWVVPVFLLAFLLLCVALAVPLLASMAQIALRIWATLRYDLPYDFKVADNAAARKLLHTFWIAGALIALRLPLILVFLVSLRPLSRVANHEYTQVSYDSPRPHDLWVGILPVSDVEVYPGGVTFVLRTGLRLHYLPGPIPEQFARRHWLLPNWYTDNPE